MKKLKKSLLVIISLSLGLVALGFMIHLNNISINLIDFYFRGFVIICFIYLIILIKDFGIKKFTVGIFIVTFSLSVDYISILNINGYSKLKDEMMFFYNLFFLFGVILLMYGIMQTLNSYKRNINRLNEIAFFDSLTRLPNRNYIIVPPSIQDITPHEDIFKLGDMKKAFLFINIDQFQLINDNLSHHIGDMILKEIAHRLSTCAGNNNLVIRLSGDEFLLILNQYNSQDKLENFTKMILKEMNRSLVIENREINLTCSIGISLYPEHGNSINILIQNADIAMNEVKKRGKGDYFIYNDSIKEKMNKRFDLLTDLHRAIKNEEFVVYFQPKGNIKTGKVTGLEALVRWQHPNLGILYPNIFIPLAEETGLIKQIDLLVIRLTCKQIKNWVENKGTIINVSINISPALIKDTMFLKRLNEIIEEYDIDPSYLGFEITENMMIEDKEKAKMVLQQIRNKKIQINLDDFGKGYSSLAYLKEFPIDVLKIDKIFIDGITTNDVDGKLIETIITISKLLGIKVISEGVETIEQLEFLKTKGCDEYQGYLLGHATPLEELNHLL